MYPFHNDNDFGVNIQHSIYSHAIDLSSSLHHDNDHNFGINIQHYLNNHIGFLFDNYHTINLFDNGHAIDLSSTLHHDSDNDNDNDFGVT
jgi:hypothetical protein